MIDVIDFTNCECGPRNFSYAGKAGEKEELKLNFKIPKNTKAMDRVNISYTTSPLSEYRVSHNVNILLKRLQN